MIKLFYTCSDHGSELNIISIYSTDEESVIDFIDANLLGIDITFMDQEGRILGKVDKSDLSCDNAVQGYHELEDDLMIDILGNDPELEKIDIYNMMVELDAVTSARILEKIRNNAKLHNVKLIED